MANDRWRPLTHVDNDTKRQNDRSLVSRDTTPSSTPIHEPVPNRPDQDEASTAGTPAKPKRNSGRGGGAANTGPDMRPGV